MKVNLLFKNVVLQVFTGFTLLVITVAPVMSSGQVLLCGEKAEPCIEYGAETFLERCAICHGSDGMGEGIIALLVKDYPSTNLYSPVKTNSWHSIRDMIIYGNTLPRVNSLSPPWSDELTLTQINATADFVTYYRKNFEAALQLLRKIKSNQQPSYENGRAIFLGRCVLCHGKTGEGDGRLAAFITSPSPANLTLSQQPDDFIKQIISKGGEAMGRSSKMPPWGDDLVSSDIESVLLYLKTLRVIE